MEVHEKQKEPRNETRLTETEMNRLLLENKDFILRCASKTCRRFITDSDDEYEIALVAFWEATKSFRSEEGDFHAFTSLVIRRRLMDYFDSQTRRSREIPIGSTLSWENEDDNPSGGILTEVQNKIVQESQTETFSAKEEIEVLGSILQKYGFSFFDLAEASPKTSKTRHCCARAVNWMLDVAERVIQMRKKHSLPVNAISKALEIARKILERHRRYIIAATEILDGDYPHLAEYLDYIKKERVI